VRTVVSGMETRRITQLRCSRAFRSGRRSQWLDASYPEMYEIVLILNLTHNQNGSFGHFCY
jgi:hypothetical protein